MAESGGEVLGEGAASSQPPPHLLRGLGERCKLPQRGPGRSSGHPSGFLHFIDARRLFLASHNSANIECVSACISLGVLFTFPKKNFSQHSGGGVEPVNPPPLK